MQFALDLQGGHHVGPLFIANKVRSKRYPFRGGHRHRMLRRKTPFWADRSLLSAFRRMVAIYTTTTDFVWSQDHIVPLHHESVCGLHCPANITVKLLDDNQRKGNRWWPDMPETQQEMFYGS